MLTGKQDINFPIILRPGSHVPPTYLGHSYRPGTTAAYVNIYRRRIMCPRHWPPTCLRSWVEFNFAGKPAINVWDRLCIGGECSHKKILCRNVVPGHAGGHVPGRSAAYENQALLTKHSWNINTWTMLGYCFLHCL